MRRTRPIVSVIVAMAILGAGQGAARAEPVGVQPDAAPRSEGFVERVTGFDVTPVRSRIPATVNGVAITAPSNRTFRTRDALIAILEQGQSDVRFGLPEGATAAISPEGGGTPGQVVLTGADGRIAIVDAPWAKDARGVSLPTHYRVEGDTLVQFVDTTGAVFPVVADPKVTSSWMFTRKTVYFNKSETSQLAAGGGLARLVTASVPGLNLVTGVLTAAALGAVVLGKCVGITGTNTTFVPGVAVPFYYSGGYCT